MRNPLSLEAFIDWLEKQPAEKEYDWSDCGKCLIGQYTAFLGMEPYESYTAMCRNLDMDEGPGLLIHMSRPRTFGAALSRARSLMSDARALSDSGEDA